MCFSKVEFSNLDLQIKKGKYNLMLKVKMTQIIKKYQIYACFVIFL